MALASHLSPSFFPNLRRPLALTDFVLCIYIGVALLALRLVCEAVCIPRLRDALVGKKPKPEKLAAKVFDDAYTALGAAVMVLWAWEVMLFENDGCTPLNTAACLAGWPDIDPQHAGRVYWVAMLGFYLYEMIGTVLQRGPSLPPIMMLHHAATWGLMGVAYMDGLIRLGLMATALLDLSNPILHAAKTLQHLGIPSLDPIKWGLFNTFALVFLLARVVAPPLTLLRVTLIDASVLPPSGYYTCNAFTLLLYGLQLFWFYKIVRLALRGDKEDDGAPKAGAGEAEKTE